MWEKGLWHLDIEIELSEQEPTADFVFPDCAVEIGKRVIEAIKALDFVKEVKIKDMGEVEAFPEWDDE